MTNQPTSPGSSPMWVELHEQTGIDLAPGINAIETALHDICAVEEPFLNATASHMAQAGGKRFRPALVLLSAIAGGMDANKPTDALIKAGVIIELTHMATLYHDDVIDAADARRGQVAAHIKWSNTVAILSGDWLLARASELSSELGIAVTNVMSKTIADLAKGQIQEVVTSLDAKRHFPDYRQTPSVDKYMQAIYGKTASLIKAAAQLGGIVSGMNDEAISQLGSFGHYVGLAFQIADDILDIEASSDQSGKVQGTDLAEGVQTLPVLYALADSAFMETPQGKAFVTWVNDPTPEHVAKSLEVLQGSYYIQQAKDQAVEMVEQASQAIVTLQEVHDVSEAVLDTMRAIAMQACDRLE